MANTAYTSRLDGETPAGTESNPMDHVHQPNQSAINTASVVPGQQGTSTAPTSNFTATANAPTQTAKGIADKLKMEKSYAMTHKEPLAHIHAMQKSGASDAQIYAYAKAVNDKHVAGKTDAEHNTDNPEGWKDYLGVSAATADKSATPGVTTDGTATVANATTAPATATTGTADATGTPDAGTTPIGSATPNPTAAGNAQATPATEEAPDTASKGALTASEQPAAVAPEEAATKEGPAKDILHGYVFGKTLDEWVDSAKKSGTSVLQTLVDDHKLTKGDKARLDKESKDKYGSEGALTNEVTLADLKKEEKKKQAIEDRKIQVKDLMKEQSLTKKQAEKVLVAKEKVKAWHKEHGDTTAEELNAKAASILKTTGKGIAGAASWLVSKVTQEDEKTGQENEPTPDGVDAVTGATEPTDESIPDFNEVLQDGAKAFSKDLEQGSVKGVKKTYTKKEADARAAKKVEAAQKGIERLKDLPGYANLTDNQRAKIKADYAKAVMGPEGIKNFASWAKDHGLNVTSDMTGEGYAASAKMGHDLDEKAAIGQINNDIVDVRNKDAGDDKTVNTSAYDKVAHKTSPKSGPQDNTKNGKPLEEVNRIHAGKDNPTREEMIEQAKKEAAEKAKQEGADKAAALAAETEAAEKAKASWRKGFHTLGDSLLSYSKAYAESGDERKALGAAIQGGQDSWAREGRKKDVHQLQQLGLSDAQINLYVNKGQLSAQSEAMLKAAATAKSTEKNLSEKQILAKLSSDSMTQIESDEAAYSKEYNGSTIDDGLSMFGAEAYGAIMQWKGDEKSLFSMISSRFLQGNVVPDRFRRAWQIQQSWIQGPLRVVSGAVLSNTEYDDYRKWLFAGPHDTPKQIKQKRLARAALRNSVDVTALVTNKKQGRYILDALKSGNYTGTAKAAGRIFLLKKDAQGKTLYEEVPSFK